ncbi:MAG: DEAD/DEAH box helicase family protein [bacterium]|nr:DEAD/DEAH box helicase family protein [bacterium]
MTLSAHGSGTAPNTPAHSGPGTSATRHAAGASQTEYAPGMRVIIRDREWLVKKVKTNTLGKKALYCTGISDLVRDKEAVFLEDLEDIVAADPAKVSLVPDTSPYFRRLSLFLESRARRMVPTDNALHIGNQAVMDPLPFQLEPAALALSRPRQRILIADTVGLGKTLEAGILISELINRGKGRRILVVTVKSMMAQFQKELWTRFTIPLIRLDSKKIRDIRAKLPSNHNPFFYYDKTIVSIDTIKRDLEYRTHLENAWWDIIVIDEAHNVAERGHDTAQRSNLAKLLADRSDTMIMLSATPHDGRAKSFASLMNILDPTAIANPSSYEKKDIRGLCIRRFKKDVQDQILGQFPDRHIDLVMCQASPLEEEAFKVFADMRLEMDDKRKSRTAGNASVADSTDSATSNTSAAAAPNSSALFKTTLEKALFSSPQACVKSVDARIAKLRKQGKCQHDIDALTNLRNALSRIKPDDFSRYQMLLELLSSKEYGWSRKADDRLVIFTERIDTMKYVAEHLREDLGLPSQAIATLDGSMNDVEIQALVEDFGRLESPIRVLVASDVASEGINLHFFCHRMIHFDIPWSLMVFQQRNGRIDRYGQEFAPDIRYMLIESASERIKGDMRILRILIEKEEQALKNIGDPALLMGRFSIDEEEQVVAGVIEQGADADSFSQALDDAEKEFNPFEMLLADDSWDSFMGNDIGDKAEPGAPATADAHTDNAKAGAPTDALANNASTIATTNTPAIAGRTPAAQNAGGTPAGNASTSATTDTLATPGDTPNAASVRTEIVKDKTLFSDEDYLRQALPLTAQCEIRNFITGRGFEINMSDDLKRRLRGIIPDEAMPDGDYLALTADKALCRDEIKRSQRTGSQVQKWPQVQYLWKLHPIFGWLNDKIDLMFARDEVPLGAVPTLEPNEVIFFCWGSIPNLKSAPVVDEIFAIHYKNDEFSKYMNLQDAAALCGLTKGIANSAYIAPLEIFTVSALVENAILRAREYLSNLCRQYNERMTPLLAKEAEKFKQLERQRKAFIADQNLSATRRQEAEREAEVVFRNFSSWVSESMTIQDNPYIRIIAVMKGKELWF